MATIPVYEPQVAPNALPAPRESFDTNAIFGGQEQLGRALQQTGALTEQATIQGLDYANHQREQAIASDVTKRMADTQQQINAILYDPQTGLKSKLGEAALPAGDDARAKIQKLVQQAGEDIATPMGKRLWQAHAASMLDSSQREILAHEAQQVQVAKRASVQGLQATALDALANAYADPAARARNIALPEGSIAAQALSPEDRDAQLAAWRRQANATVLNQYVASRDYKGAEAYFAQVKDQLGQDSAQYEHTISTLKAQQVGDQTALAALNGARRPNGFIDDAKALAELEKLPAGPDKQQTEEAFHKYLGLEKQAESNKKSQVFDRAFASYLGNHSLADVPAGAKSWLQQNDPEGWSRLEQLSIAWNKKDQDPQQTANYITVLAAMEQNPLAFKGMSPQEFNARFAPVLGEKDWKQAGQKFAAIQKTPDFTLTGRNATAVQEVFADAFGLGKNVDPKKWPADKLELWRDVHDYVEHQATVWQRDHAGKPPPEEELAKLARDRTAKGTVTGGGRIFGDASTTRVEAQHNPRFAGKPFVEDVPDDFAARVKAIAKAKKQPAPSDEAIRAMYERAKQLGAP